MAALRVAVATRCFGASLLDSLQLAVDCGATAVQFDVRDEIRAVDFGESACRQFKQRLAEQRLHLASVTFPLRRTLYDPQHLEDRLRAIKTAMQFGWQLGATVLTLRPGRIPEADSKEFSTYVEILNDLAKLSNHVGVTIALTPTNESPAALETLFDAIKAGPLGLDFDPAAFVTAGHPPHKAFRLLHSQVLHFTARDAIRDVDGGGVEMAVGKGQVEWIELLPLLPEADYRGYVTAVRTQGDDRAGDVARAVRVLNSSDFR